MTILWIKCRVFQHYQLKESTEKTFRFSWSYVPQQRYETDNKNNALNCFRFWSLIQFIRFREISERSMLRRRLLGMEKYKNNVDRNWFYKLIKIPAVSIIQNCDVSFINIIFFLPYIWADKNWLSTCSLVHLRINYKMTKEIRFHCKPLNSFNT